MVDSKVISPSGINKDVFLQEEIKSFFPEKRGAREKTSYTTNIPWSEHRNPWTTEGICRELFVRRRYKFFAKLIGKEIIYEHTRIYLDNKLN